MKRPVSLHQTLAGFVDHLLQWKDHPFLVGRKGYRLDTWTYREVWSSVHAFASILGEHGIGTGNRVVIALPQSPEWVVAFLAVLVQGSVVIPLDPSAPRQFIEAVCSKTSPGAFVATDALLKEGLNISATPVPLSSLKRYRSMESGPKAPEPGNRSDLAEIVFTSGTTSQPKGVKLSHGNILFNIDPIQRGIGEHRVLVGLFPRIRMLCTVPYTHMFGQVTGIFLPILLGSTVYFTDDTAPAVLIRIIKRNRILTLITVPRIMKLLADHARYEMKARGVYDRFLKRWDKRQHLPWPIRVPFFLDLHRIMGMRFWSFIVGGASLDPETHEFWRRTVFSVFQGYGLTETAPIVTMFNPFRHPRDSVGIVMPGQELRLAPDGEILVRGGNIMQGYYDDPGSTREVLEDGWLHTGDIGEIDENGRVFIRGRKKEMILTSDGHNVYPTDVEHVLNEQPGVRESVVFGRPGPSGEAVHAVLLLEPGADPERIVQTANTLLGAHQRVRSFEPWDEADFPRTSTLKVKKAEVIDVVKGQWKGVNEYLEIASNGNLKRFNAYSMMEDPMTSCGCFECITAILPETNGVMIASREYTEMTPIGMSFSTMAGQIGGGIQTPGFIGMGKLYITSKKFISADGGIERVVWMPKQLREEIRERLVKRLEEIGKSDLLDKIATEEDATTSEELLEFLQTVGHPVLEMQPMM